jgi:hypothetical protein
MFDKDIGTGQGENGETKPNMYVEFESCTFSKLARFSVSKQANHFVLSECRFEDYVIFGRFAKYWIDGQMTFQGTSIVLTNNIFDHPTKIWFRDIDLSKLDVDWTDMELARFSNVKWPEDRSRIMNRSRIMLAEHERLKKKYGIIPELKTQSHWRRITRKKNLEDYKDEARSHFNVMTNTYRQLKNNMVAHRSFIEAGQFHFEEKLLQLKNPATSFMMRVLLCLYFLAAGFGERPFWAAAWWMVILSVFSILFSCHYDVSILNALYESFKAMVYWKPLTIDSYSIYPEHYRVFQSILSAIFFGLFAFGIRQQLRRS